MSFRKPFLIFIGLSLIIISGCDLFNENQVPRLGQVNCVLTDLYVEFTWTQATGAAMYIDIVYNGITYSSRMIAYSARIGNITPADQYKFSVYARGENGKLSPGVAFNLVPDDQYRILNDCTYTIVNPAGLQVIDGAAIKSLKSIFEYHYNDAGQVSRKDEYGSDQKLKKYEEFAYDEAGKVKTRKLTENGQITEDDQYEYDEHGGLLKIKDKDGKEKGPVYEYSYNAQGQLSGRTVLEKGVVMETSTYLFDGNGQLVKETVVEQKTSVQMDKEYTYAGLGLVKDEKWTKAGVVIRQVVKSYDSRNRLTLLDQNEYESGNRQKIVYEMGFAGNPCRISTYNNEIWSEYSEKLWEPAGTP